MKTYLNLGCGQRYHKDWTNIDFISNDKYVNQHNLLEGIPFEDKNFNVVYHSHVLEHFSKQDGQKFIQECYRVLKKEGIIRIAIPDLEQIVREYLKNLELALKANTEAEQNYEWILLEMYDQAIRTKSGGNMAAYIFQEEIPNEKYVFSRIGEEGKNLRKNYFKNMNKTTNNIINEQKKIGFIRKIINKFKTILRNYLFKEEIIFYLQEKKYATLGRFRMGGEIHQWMYDRYSLKKLLLETGFQKVELKTAFESNIPNWQSYELESKNNNVFKPDSLFMEAQKM